MRVTIRVAFLAVVAPVVSGCASSHVEGSVRAEGPNVGAWTLAPNHCHCSAAGPVNLHLYRGNSGDRPPEDAEVVLLLPDSDEPLLLARAPGKQ